MQIKSKPPLIGITTASQYLTGSFYLPGVYVNAVRSAGGLPILLPPGEPEEGTAILERIDGLIFSGGGDIDPSTYNGPIHPTIYNLDPERDRFEIALSKLVLSTDIPVLGICRGLEVLVVATGGSLVSHLPDEFGDVVLHRAEQTLPSEHSVQIASESRLATIMGTTEATVVSWHHQATSTVPQGWRVAAHAPDRVIEALEHERHPWALALQWHPELSIKDLRQARIFRAFIEAAQNRKAVLLQIHHCG